MSSSPPPPSSSSSGAPGAARQGNFINYYQFNPAQERVRLLPGDILSRVTAGDGEKDTPVLCLDVGCNTGELTAELRRHLKQESSKRDVFVHGVDVDEVLILRAKEQQQQQEGEAKGGGDGVSFSHGDIMEESVVDELKKIVGDRGKDCFDLAFCFSVSMWIHLNHGDAGLRAFFSRLASLSRFVLLEPQPWKCYQTAARRMRKLGEPEFEHLRTMEHRGENLEPFIVSLLVECGFKVIEEFGKTNWKRKVMLLKRDDNE